MRFYFLGICGTAMGNVAVMMKSKGHEVFGVDEGTYEPMAGVLREAGIGIFEGYEAERVRDLRPDMVVVGNVIARGNEEIEYILDSGQYAYCSLPELMRKEILMDRKNVVVAGTHGKTTTTSLIAYLMEEVGMNPGYMIGGVPKCLPSGCKIGMNGGAFVIEGDEYDSAFFDKRSKFIHYNPHVLIINNIEFDHADIFRDLEDVKRTFRHVTRLVPRSGYILINGDDENVMSVLPINWCPVVKVGFGDENDLVIKNYEEDRESTVFELCWRGRELGRVKWGLGGRYNARNAAMAILATGLIGGELENIDLSVLGKFSGVRRRQEVKYSDEKLIVIEDFGHHPTAVGLTLESLKARYRGHEIIACLEPRSYTAASNCHQEAFAKSLRIADRVYIGRVHNREKIRNPLDVESLVSELGEGAQAFEENGKLFDVLRERTLGSDRAQIVCFFSNGSFGGVIERYVNFCDEW